MYNRFEVLQSKCRRYYLKKYLITLLPVTILIAGLFFYIQTSQNIDKKDEVYKEVEEPKVVSKPIEKIEPEIEKPQPTQKRVIKDVPYELEMYSYNLLNKKREATPKESVVVKQEGVKVEVVEPKQIAVVESKTPFSISVKKIDSLADMIRAYNNDPKYSLALKIAQHYFDNKNYVQSLSWSKKANKLDAKGSEAWILYAKSEYESGNREKAKELLKMYVSSSNSKEAKELLISWVKGDK